MITGFPRRGDRGPRGHQEEMRESDLTYYRAWRHANLAAGSAAAKPLEHRPASVRAGRGDCRTANADFGLRHPAPGEFRRGCLANLPLRGESPVEPGAASTRSERSPQPTHSDLVEA